ncbi:UDP-glucuronosyl/UDP-glucosyltransferase [Macleaya cordata]|uniref:UDP-glucuronosyl/UDP-glucosyltransferase n=1 Tax=Macleaya cordata TaxID=56857 RepID=A0A200PX57_MACCD|nr:UDP-glucuronosyl/UDP-glucosyltransferase [Macleaya cordata]
MDRISGGTTGCRVVAMPYPARGHINPMMNVCKLLVSKLMDIINITFIVTEEWLGFIESEPRPPQIQLRSIPNVIPSELVRGSDRPAFVEAIFTKMEGPIEQILEQMQESSLMPVVTAIIADTLLSWAVSIGNRRNIPVVSLWTMSPSVFSVFCHFDLVTQNGHSAVDTSSERGDELIDYIPGISPAIRLADMPRMLHKTRVQVSGRMSEAFAFVHKAQCLIFTSFHELEAQVTETLMAVLPFPVYSVGPSIPHSTTLAGDHEREQTTTITHNNNNMDYYFKWLDSQPKSSVLYVSFGSFYSVSREQMDEILAGLRESGVRYLLVSRGDHASGTVPPDDDDDEMLSSNLVVPWCDQLRVLCHSSVGGFWTHCGWNSTLEGVFAGVPMLTFPLGFDQITDRKLIVDDWKVGMKVMKEVGAERFVRKEEIGMIVKKFMDLDGDDEESKEMRRRAGELKESCRRALAKGGSSDTNLNAFIRDILKCHC